MTLKTSTTGSYPPIFDPDLTFHADADSEHEFKIQKSIKRAVEDQLRLGIDILVDGQVRDDIVSLFAKHLPAFDEKQLPYRIAGKIQPLGEGITVDDYKQAVDLVPEGNNKPVKAHVTGPMTIARGSYLDTSIYESLAVCRRANKDSKNGDRLRAWLENLRNPIMK
jgi:5-methyltetrahydropteroyltriglutamate--homocysteine methyltransferase